MKKAALLLGSALCVAVALLIVELWTHPVSIVVPELKSLTDDSKSSEVAPQNMFVTDTSDEYNDTGTNKIGDTVFMMPNYNAKLIGRIAHPGTTFSFDRDPKKLVSEVSALLKTQKGWKVKPFDPETLFADVGDGKGNPGISVYVGWNAYSKRSQIMVLDWSKRIPAWRMWIYDRIHI